MAPISNVNQAIDYCLKFWRNRLSHSRKTKKELFCVSTILHVVVCNFASVPIYCIIYEQARPYQGIEIQTNAAIWQGLCNPRCSRQICKQFVLPRANCAESRNSSQHVKTGLHRACKENQSLSLNCTYKYIHISMNFWYNPYAYV